MKKPVLAALALALSIVVLRAQTPTDSWPTYNGDYSGRRFSPLTKINASNINALGLAWMYRLTATPGASSNIKSTPLMIDGVVYFTTEDNAFAVDARTGREIWHYVWASSGGRHNGNKGMGQRGNALFFETGDCHLVALNKDDGKLLWSKTICDLEQFYFASAAPVVVGDHVITGVSGDDSDVPGYIESHDPSTGDLQWRFNTVPLKKGDPGMETWSDEDVAAHGGGMTWIPPTYDPDLKLLYVPTGNPQPVIAYANRKGDNLYTGSVVALNVDTGKLAWYFQTSPHDTHDWDSTQTPVLFDGTINGQPRKLLAQAARNGHFFVLDRTTGKAIVSTEYVKTNWSLGNDEKGQPIPNPAKFPSLSGTLVSPNQGGAANWYPPTFSPATGLFYVNSTRAFSVYYLYDGTDNPQGWGGNDRGGWSESMLQAIDYRTGAIKWRHRWEGGSSYGLLSTAGNLIFSGAVGNALVALNATTGDALWHTRLASNVSNPPTTWELDGTQFLIVGGGDTLYAFAMRAR